MNLTDKNFEKEIGEAEKPVLVDFFADWCNPCFILEPILEKIAEEYKDRMILAKASLDTVPIVAQKFNIESIPAVILFKKGKPVSGFIGVQPEDNIRKWLEDNLKD